MTDRIIDDVEYRAIEGFPGYRVGSDGSVWSEKSGVWKKRKLCPAGRGGYLGVSLRNKDKRRNTRLVHRLVLETFVTAKPDDCETRHLDGNPLNNYLSNLAWGTSQENGSDMICHGKSLRGSKNYNSKLTKKDILTIRDRLNGGCTGAAIARAYGVHRATVSRIKTRARWGWLKQASCDL